MSGRLKFSVNPGLKNPSLIIGWSVDAAGLGTKVTDYLIQQLGCQSCCEIEPVGFFPLGGVSIADDLIQFPESKFYACPEHDLLVFKSVPPAYEWHLFFNLVLDAAQEYQVRELYTIGGMVSLGAHTAPRQMVGTFNSTELKESLSQYRLTTGLDYETPPGQRPTLNSFLLWAALERKVPGVSLWAPIPLYLVSIQDPAAEKLILELFNERFGLQLDFAELDKETSRLNQVIAEAREQFPELDQSLSRLESNLMLSEEENQKLVQRIQMLFEEEV